MGVKTYGTVGSGIVLHVVSCSQLGQTAGTVPCAENQAPQRRQNNTSGIHTPADIRAGFARRLGRSALD